MFVAIDLETTWLDKYNDKIIEVWMVKFDEVSFQIIEEFSTFVDPLIPIPSITTNITNISDFDVKWAPYIEDIKDKIIDFIWDSPILWQNIGFDIGFLVNNNIDIVDNIYIDTFFLSNFLCINEKSLNLEALCKSFWIWFDWAHRALNDIKATVRLFSKLVEKFRKLNKTKKELLYYVFSKSSDNNVEFIKSYLFWDFIWKYNFEKFEKVILKNIWKYSSNIDNIKNKDYVYNDLSTIYESIWILEKRDNQLKMTSEVLDIFNKWKKSLIEAPTWLWKSFAYLIPSIIYSVSNWKKVFISTKTKALQDQLFEKDLKFLLDKLDVDFDFCKLKWKKNYLWIKNLFEEFFLDNLSFEKVTFLSKIVLWLLETKYWEIDELNYHWQEYLFLRNISSDSFYILRDDNLYKDYEFLYKARTKLEHSNIVIINHNLLFSDLVSESSILWNIENLVIDEAHNIDDSITDSLKKSFNINNLEEVFSFINDVYNKKGLNKIELVKKQEDLLSNIELILDYSFSYLNSVVSNDNKYKVVLIKEDFFHKTDFKSLINKIELVFLDIIDTLSIIEDFDFIREKWLLQDMFDIIKIVIDEKSLKNNICMISYSEKLWVSLDYTLLNPWNYLKNNIWDNLDSLLLTSATLKIGDSFEYFKNILNLWENFEFFSFDSDFDYHKQATLFIPNDLWSIKSNSKNIINFLRIFYSVARWNVLTLLTSFSIIRNIYTELNNDLKKQWINLYAQSIWWSKNKLLSFYLEDPDNSILLWTDSFWEWIDIPWDSLKYLIIHKFPFSVPTDPVFQARSSLFKDSFKDYAIPKAIIKLKQWFWRLIRTKKDTWIVIFLDDRIYNSSWWEEFYNAFPSNINIKIASSKDFFDILKRKKIE